MTTDAVRTDRASELAFNSTMGSIYSPLDPQAKQIRTLTIHPGTPGEAISCSLAVVEFCDDHTPEYETCSYVWGDAKIRSKIIVDGHEVDVPLSSATVLGRVRLQDKPRTVWIDALCINQTDDSERAQQVGMMGKVFSRGAGNLVYLCGEEDYVENALNTVRSMLADENVQRHLMEPKTESGFLRVASVNRLRSSWNLDALENLFASPWFRRVWTFQEAYLPEHSVCLCGQCEIRLLDITQVAFVLNLNPSFISEDLLSTSRQAAILNQSIDPSMSHPSRKSYLWFMDTMQNRESLLPIDKVYGILGLIPDADIKPDYQKDTLDVHRDFARAIIRHDSDLYLLHYAISSAPDIQASSWVPNWHSEFDRKNEPLRFGPFFEAGGRVSYRHPYSHLKESGLADPAILLAEGFMLGYVQETLTMSLDHTDILNFDNLERFQTRIKQILQRASADEIELAIAVTLCAGNDAYSQPAGPSSVRQHRAWMECFVEGHSIPFLHEITPETPQEHVLASQYCHSMWVACSRRKAFTTGNGCWGLGPPGMHAGDVVVVFYGLDMPAVLRAVGGRYVFVGLAYVHGVMYGEAAQRHKDSGAEDVHFEIQ